MERLPALVKSMHLKKPMQVKLGKSDKAKTHLVKKDEVVKYHLAWVNYNAKSGKYQNATCSLGHLKLHTQLQRDPQLVFQSPEPEGSWWPVVCSKNLPGVVATGPSSSFGWLLGLGDDHRRGGLSHTKPLVPFLVLHRVRAGEGNIKALPCPFLGVTPS